MDFIFINMSSYSDWQKGVQNTNYHILQGLAKQDKVGKIMAVDFLPNNIRLAAKRFLLDIIKVPKQCQVIKRDPLRACVLIKENIYVYSTIENLFSQDFLVKRLNKLIDELQFSKRVVICFDPFSAELINDFDAQKTVFYTVDNWQQHSAYTKVQDKLISGYKQASVQADLIINVAQELKQMWAEYGREKNVVWLPNGIDWKIFADFNKVQTPDFFQTHQIKHPVVGYIGVVQKNRFDFDLLLYLAKKNPDKSFVIGGPVWQEVKQTINEKFSNVHNVFFTHEYIAREKWPDFAAQFDVAINPHKLNEFSKFTNPTKISEYLACGKPVVSTQVSGVDVFEENIYVAKDKKDFNDKLNLALKMNSAEQNLQRQSFVKKNHQWQNRCNQLLKLIDQI